MLEGPLLARLKSGERLSFDDGVALFRHPDLLTLAQHANAERERRWETRTFYNRNLHLNITNVCVARCPFCSFARPTPDEPGAYTMSTADAAHRLRVRLDAGERITEAHIVNGLHPGLPFETYEELLRTLRRVAPSVHLKAFTAVEIWFFHETFGLELRQVLQRLRDAGLGSLPGGGAEIFAGRVRQRLSPGKCSADQWLAVHRTAHQLGLRSNATMLFGTIETVEERVDHLLRLRALQDETGGFQTFIPLAFHHENNSWSALPPPTAADALRTVAVSRLLLDNVPHIKAYWASLGVDTAQAAQWFGADDIDGTLTEERVYQAAGARNPRALTVDAIERLIRSAGREPVERDTLYRTWEGAARDAGMREGTALPPPTSPPPCTREGAARDAGMREGAALPPPTNPPPWASDGQVLACDSSGGQSPPPVREGEAAGQTLASASFGEHGSPSVGASAGRTDLVGRKL